MSKNYIGAYSILHLNLLLFFICFVFVSSNVKIKVYSIIILLILYGRESWSFTSKEKT
jgi:hypothetical protein